MAKYTIHTLFSKGVKIMRLKCLFCRYKSVCLPEQESHLTDYQKLQKMYLEVVENYRILSEDYNDLYVKYENLKYNLQNFIRENERR